MPRSWRRLGDSHGSPWITNPSNGAGGGGLNYPVDRRNMVDGRLGPTERGDLAVFDIVGLVCAGLAAIAALTRPSTEPAEDVIRRLPRGCHEIALTFELIGNFSGVFARAG